jgi:hypothetical protein
METAEYAASEENIDCACGPCSVHSCSASDDVDKKVKRAEWR